MPTLTEIANERDREALDIYGQTAARLIVKHGYTEARRKTIELRDMSVNGTANYAFHNATLKSLERIHSEYRQQC